MSAVFLLLGSNTFPRFVYLQHALGMLRQLPMELKQVSPFYETAPWGKTDQSDFLNVAVQVVTSLPPLALLERLKAIEQQLGRTSAQKWGPREIDLDILFYGEEMIHTESLVIPHPELQHRRFALVPLHDIAPDFVHPVFKKKVSKLLEQSADKGEVRYYCEGDFQSKTITVIGKVQGVGFRFYTERVAKELGVKGTVRNLPNGNVFCEAEAPDATLNTFISFCHQGPSTAQVNEVVVTEKEPEFFKRFEIVR